LLLDFMPIPASTTPEFSSTVLELADQLRLDVLLECPTTADSVIRFICITRKELLEAAEMTNTPEVVEAERIVSRLYHLFGYERRNLAYQRNAR
jgi:hypothetical protein